MFDDDKYFQEKTFLNLLQRYEDSIQEFGTTYMDAEDLTDIAEYYMMKGEKENANKAISLALDLHPDSVDPLIFLSREAMFDDDLEEAYRICNSIPDQEDREVKFLRAELLLRENKKEEAKELLMQASEAAMDDEAYFLLDSAGIFLDYSCEDLAVLFAELLYEKYPNFLKGKSILAEAYSLQGNNEKAIFLLKELIDEDPYNIDYWNFLAESYGVLERYTDALDTVEYALAIDQKNKRALLTKASCYYYMNMSEQTHSLLTEYLSELKENYMAYYLDGSSLVDMGCYEEAIVQLEKAIELSQSLSPEQYQICSQLAYSYMKLGMEEKALKAIDDAAASDPKSRDTELNMRKGILYLDLNKPEKAQEYFQKAISNSGDVEHTLYKIGALCTEEGKYEDAIMFMKPVINAHKTDNAQKALPYMAYCLMQTGSKEYVLFLKKAAEYEPSVTKHLFEEEFPNVLPEDYYYYAYYKEYGKYPNNG